MRNSKGMNGRIFQLNTSAGGVPKLAIHEGVVNELGLVGDEHRFPDIHGGPERALFFFLWKEFWSCKRKDIQSSRVLLGKTLRFPASSGKS